MRALEAQRDPMNPESVVEANRRSIPIGRYATAEEIANTVLYLCSDLSGSVTGTYLVVDGGRAGSGGSPYRPR